MGILKRYKYLGAYVQDSGEVEREVTCKMQAGWLKWREASGLLCDKRVLLKLKGKYYSTVVRPIMLYSAECWALKKSQEQKVKVTEMKMLRMMRGVTKSDRVRNEYIRSSLGVESIEDRLAV